MIRNSYIPKVLYAAIMLVFLYLDYLIYRSGHPVLGVLILAVIGLAAFVYANGKTYAWRYLFPSLLGFGMFVIIPLIYTIYVAFTNYSGNNLLTFEETKAYFQREKTVDANKSYPLKVYAGNSADEYILSVEIAAGQSQETVYLISDPLRVPQDNPVELSVVQEKSPPSGTPLLVPQVIKIRTSLKNITLIDPVTSSGLRMNSFTTFAPTLNTWSYDPKDESFKNVENGQIVRPDFATGFYMDDQKQPIGPGFRVQIGWGNFTQIFTNESVRGPFITVFIWTILFALFSVLLTFILGFLLAVLLEWEAIRGQKIWRSLIILPYAVPAFISILIFRGLFNPQFGDINAFLNMLFGIRPDWTTDPLLARVMVLLVNLWLGYPYMMILCTGILQSVPKDIYEASAIDGGTPLSDVYRMTLPLILPPLKPLLIASFAFNFNNFLLIQLLTGGAPQMVGASTSVGYTDILVTYTFNLAFRNAGANYGFASAIATIIFVIVSILSYVNLKAATRNDAKNKR
ncbi:MAG: maltose ABC transporter permease MalF [Kiritimatiellae bacterium]|nr:maltose ABC transporter permease MalF [Kiritimatiellia bacterium]MDD4735367.1 maltose ABC transporter permease MalF [Kiritimatiellia bacterium]